MAFKYIKQVLFYFFIFAFCYAFCVAEHSMDFDIFSRLIMGKHVVEAGSVMYNDIVSYTPVHTWFDHEWLSSTFIYIVLKYFGADGLVIFKAFLSSLTVFLIYKNINIISKTDTLKPFYIVVCLFILLRISFFTTLRCQDFTFVFLPLIVYLLEKIRADYSFKYAYVIPFIMLLWLNCHGGAMFGLAIIFLYGLGQLLNKSEYKKYFIILIFSTLAYLVNPWGIDFIKFMIFAIYVDRHWVGEWQSPFAMTIENLIDYLVSLAIAIPIVVSGFIINKKKNNNFDFAKFFVLSLFLVLSLRYIKHTFILYILLLIYIYNDFKLLFINKLDKIGNKLKLSFSVFIYLLGFIFTLVVSYYNPISTCWRDKTFSNLPLRPLEFLVKNNIKGNILTDYSDGGFIAYKHYPDLKIYMDGRQEQVYDYSVLSDLMKFLFYEDDDFYNAIEKYPPDIILIRSYWMVNEFLQKNDYYKNVYFDKDYLIYLSPKVQKMSYIYPKYASSYSIDNFFDTNINFK